MSTREEFWTTLFPDFHADARLVFEIGPGWGEYLLNRAASAPQRDFFVSIDRQHDRCEKHAKRAVEAGRLPSHYRVVSGYLETFLALIPAASIDELITLYPDPWPKRKHAKKRLFAPVILLPLLRSLRAGALWTFATDMESYASMAVQTLENIRARAGLPLELKTLTLSSSTTEARTAFEKRCFARGWTCFQIEITMGKNQGIPLNSDDALFRVPHRFAVGQTL
jgi:tRNA G46 methylase TrmB